MASNSTSDDQDFKILKQIGEGGYGSVYLVQHVEWEEVVLKKLRDPNSSDGRELNSLQREADILKSLRHPNIVTLYEGRFESQFCGLFMEFVKYGSVDSFMKQFYVSSVWKFQIIFDVSRAMCFLHKQQPPIIHGDLKCQNILIGNDFRAKICDFGLARIGTFTESYSDHAVQGTPAFIAPEYFQNPRKKKTEKFDVYSFAITVWEIFSGKRAYYDFADAQLIPVFVMKTARPMMGEINGVINEVLDKLIQDCWNQEPAERPTFYNIRKCLGIEIKIKNGSHQLETALRNLMAQKRSNSPQSGILFSESGTIILRIFLGSDQPDNITINKHGTIDELYDLVNARFSKQFDGIHGFHLICGTELELGRNLQDYGIRNNAAVYILIRCYGGGNIIREEISDESSDEYTDAKSN